MYLPRKHLLSFVDNHDVSRIATILEDKQQLPVIYGLLFGMPGVPSIYYGSEWGIEGKKQGRDEEIRPRLEKPEWNELSDAIAAYAKAHHTHPALYNGGYANLLVRDKQLIFERSCDEERVIVAINGRFQHISLILMRAPVLEQILLQEKLLTLAVGWIFHHIAWLTGKPK